MFPEDDSDEKIIKSLRKRRVSVLGDNKADNNEDSLWPSTNVKEKEKASRAKGDGSSVLETLKGKRKKKKQQGKKEPTEVNPETGGDLPKPPTPPGPTPPTPPGPTPPTPPIPGPPKPEPPKPGFPPFPEGPTVGGEGTDEGNTDETEEKMFSKTAPTKTSSFPNPFLMNTIFTKITHMHFMMHPDMGLRLTSRLQNSAASRAGISQ